jgi:uncharacterized protein with GYD domain
MPVYATVAKFTSQEVTSMSHVRKALDESTTQAREMGIKVINGYVTLGPYDMMLIYEAADEKAAAMLAMNFSSKWGGRPETWTLIPKEEFSKIPDKSKGFS